MDKLFKIKVVVTDIDGVWTDGGMYYTDQGEAMKRFNTRDGMGVARLRAVSVETVIATSEDTQIVKARAKKLGIKHCHIGVADKGELLDVICSDLGVMPEQVAHIGDDVNDLGLFERVGFSACPGDAFEQAKDKADYVCRHGGGEGAFREFAELIVSEKTGV